MHYTINALNATVSTKTVRQPSSSIGSKIHNPRRYVLGVAPCNLVPVPKDENPVKGTHRVEGIAMIQGGLQAVPDSVT